MGVVTSTLLFSSSMLHATDGMESHEQIDAHDVDKAPEIEYSSAHNDLCQFRGMWSPSSAIVQTYFPRAAPVHDPSLYSPIDLSSSDRGCAERAVGTRCLRVLVVSVLHLAHHPCVPLNPW